MSTQANLVIGKKPVQIITQNNYSRNGLLVFTVLPETPH